MATIEERTEEFAHNEGCMQCVRQKCYLTDCEKESRLKNQYIKIATEQRKIDIEKASFWWYNKMNELYPNELFGETIEEFRKAMEE